MHPVIEQILVRSGLVLLYAACFSCLIVTFLGLGGNWILAAVALVIKLTGLGTMTWPWVVAAFVLAALGEVIEAVLGMVVVARRGGTRWGVIGAFAGGVVGAVLGAPVAPPVGTLLFAFAGAFAGAAVGEYLRDRRVDNAVRVGFWSFVGRSLAALGKVAVGVGIVWIIILTTW